MTSDNFRGSFQSDRLVTLVRIVETLALFSSPLTYVTTFNMYCFANGVEIWIKRGVVEQNVLLVFLLLFN